MVSANLPIYRVGVIGMGAVVRVQNLRQLVEGVEAIVDLPAADIGLREQVAEEVIGSERVAAWIGHAGALHKRVVAVAANARAVNRLRELSRHIVREP